MEKSETSKNKTKKHVALRTRRQTKTEETEGNLITPLPVIEEVVIDSAPAVISMEITKKTLIDNESCIGPSLTPGVNDRRFRRFLWVVIALLAAGLAWVIATGDWGGSSVNPETLFRGPNGVPSVQGPATPPPGSK